ncbi:MAG: sulfite exporter TauE/SafE family protein [Capnocytophaga sp.]|nr:sulfite exporter TauE/SafE family protein [Capnocytophaga sp.]
MFYIAFMMGLLGSFHCVGMCGPIALMIPVRQDNFLIKISQIIIYFLGKTLTYSLLGILFGLLGRGLFLREYQQNFSIFIGICMVVIGLFSIFNIKPKSIENPILIGLTHLKSALGKQLRKKTFFSVFSIGFLNGFLPCGLVYMALFSALTTVTIEQTALFMCFFGLGTIPLMFLFVLLGNFLSLKIRNYIQKVIPFFIILIGILFIIRGLGLGIHFVSPANTDLIIQNNPECIT